MDKPFQELLQQLKGIDEVTLLELIGITSEDLVNEYEDKIYDREATIRRFIGEEYEEEESPYLGSESD